MTLIKVLIALIVYTSADRESKSTKSCKLEAWLGSRNVVIASFALLSTCSAISSRQDCQCASLPGISDSRSINELVQF